MMNRFPDPSALDVSVVYVAIGDAARAQVEQAQQPATVTTAPAQANGVAAMQNNAYNSQLLNLSNAQRIQGNYRIGPTNQRVLDALRDGN